MALLTRGSIKSAAEGKLVFTPLNTNYELDLGVAPGTGLVPGEEVCGTIRLKARKVWTVSAGGNFIQPLFGEPRWIQGRVKSVEGSIMLVQAGTSLAIELPPEKTALDLKNGPLVPGVMVNVTIQPGASFELGKA